MINPNGGADQPRHLFTISDMQFVRNLRLCLRELVKSLWFQLQQNNTTRMTHIMLRAETDFQEWGENAHAGCESRGGRSGCQLAEFPRGDRATEIQPHWQTITRIAAGRNRGRGRVRREMPVRIMYQYFTRQPSLYSGQLDGVVILHSCHLAAQPCNRHYTLFCMDTGPLTCLGYALHTSGGASPLICLPAVVVSHKPE